MVFLRLVEVLPYEIAFVSGAVLYAMVIPVTPSALGDDISKGIVKMSILSIGKDRSNWISCAAFHLATV